MLTDAPPVAPPPEQREQTDVEDDRREPSSVAIDEDPTAWRCVEADYVPLGEAHASLPVKEDGPLWRKVANYSGVGFLIGVGYMDPGNWATDIAGGAAYQYQLMCIVMMASITAMLLQYLALKLGIATGRDLAMAIRDSFPRRVVLALWVVMELAIAATELAELLGSAIALHLLLGIPLVAGVLLTVVDVFLILLVQDKRFRFLEYLVMAFTATLTVLLFALVVKASPVWSDVFAGLIPTRALFTSPDMLFVAIGIIGATVMPHNLFLHGALVQTRKFARTTEGRQRAIKYANIDSILSLFLAFLVNASLLILAGAVFYPKYSDTAGIEDAYQLLTPLLGLSPASVMFCVALLAAAQQASLTGTLAGQVIMEGMTSIKLAPWKRRLITRLVAMTPALVVTAIYPGGTGNLLIISQVVLSIALSFATFPLVWITSNKKKMGPVFVNSRVTMFFSGLSILVMAGLNAYIVCSPDTWSLQ